MPRVLSRQILPSRATTCHLPLGSFTTWAWSAPLKVDFVELQIPGNLLGIRHAEGRAFGINVQFQIVARICGPVYELRVVSAVGLRHHRAAEQECCCQNCDFFHGSV